MICKSSHQNTDDRTLQTIYWNRSLICNNIGEIPNTHLSSSEKVLAEATKTITTTLCGTQNNYTKKRWACRDLQLQGIGLKSISSKSLGSHSLCFGNFRFSSLSFRSLNLKSLSVEWLSFENISSKRFGLKNLSFRSHSCENFSS